MSSWTAVFLVGQLGSSLITTWSWWISPEFIWASGEFLDRNADRRDILLLNLSDLIYVTMIATLRIIGQFYHNRIKQTFRLLSPVYIFFVNLYIASSRNQPMLGILLPPPLSSKKVPDLINLLTFISWTLDVHDKLFDTIFTFDKWLFVKKLFLWIS